MAPREWTRSTLHFDNVPVALLTLFEIASLELWLDPMYDAMDMPARLGQQPIRDYSFGTCSVSE